MPFTNSWLVTYAIAQLGKPYVWGAAGAFQVSERERFGKGMNSGPNPWYRKSVKVHDCSGLVYGALSCSSTNGNPDTNPQITHNAQTQFDRDCTQKGQLTSDIIARMPPGTLVFKGSLTNLYHVGVYVGPITFKGVSYTYGVVEAMGSDYGVVISDANNWGYWGQLTVCEVNTSASGLTMQDVSTTGPYGNLSETPSSYNSGRESQVVSNVAWEQTGTDINGNPIGYSYTSGANFTPFIATVSPSADKVDYPALINNKVSGMMFCAGWLYNNYTIGHAPRKEYINSKLKAQVLGCQTAELPYALYAIVRSKTRIEADRECRELYYVISKYPPGLGLWLYLDMHNQKLVNEEILDCYYKYIVDWGLGAKCGLYVDSSRLQQIDWNKYQNKFHLWLIDHVDQTTLNSINDRVLKSDFFEVD